MSLWQSSTFWSGVGTGVSCCVAFGFILMNGHRLSALVPFARFGNGLKTLADKARLRNTKMVFVVRMDVGMQKGKMAAQCSHAAVMAYKAASVSHPETLKSWEFAGQPKIVCKVNSEEEMLLIAQKAKGLGLVTAMVRDAGRTQVVPGTKTVLSVGPGPVELVDECTSHLKLL